MNWWNICNWYYSEKIKIKLTPENLMVLRLKPNTPPGAWTTPVAYPSWGFKSKTKPVHGNNYKSDIKCRNIISYLDRYMAPNSKYTGGECPQNVSAPLNMLSALMINIWHQISNTLEMSAPRPQMEVNTSSQMRGWLTPTTLFIKTNSPLKGLEWVKDGHCIYPGRQTEHKYLTLTPE